MVMNAEVEWIERNKAWNQKQSDYFAAQKALDDIMSLYLQAKGPPPNVQAIKAVDDLRKQMLDARAFADEFVADYAVDGSQKRNLPRHQ